MKQQQQFNLENDIRGTRLSFANSAIPYPISVILDWYKSVIDRKNLVWDNLQQSRLIESLLLDIPINILFVNMIDEQLNVIDGSQRIATISRFVNNELVLSDLEILVSLNLSTFNDLLPSRQKRFMRHPILVCELPEVLNKREQTDIRNRVNGMIK